MRKLLLLLIGFVLYAGTSFSQKKAGNTGQPKQEKQGHCATDNLHISLTEQSPSYKRKLDEMNANYQKWAMENNSGNKKINGNNSTQAYQATTLPVIFHMMVNTFSSNLNPTASSTDGNLTKTQIQSALTILNQLYAGTAVGSKPAGFNTDIQFCLAEVDNYGNAITSYTYTDPSFSLALSNTNQSQITALSNIVQNTGRFPTTKYINIYVVEDITSPVAGFAYMPPAHGSSFDGIYIEAQYLMAPLTGTDDAVYNMTVLTHEMGHYLGMFHTFGICINPLLACSCNNYNCLFDGDMVCDTPPDYSQTTAIGGCLTPTNTCGTDVATLGDALNLTSDVDDLPNNYMDYGNWNCFYSFTQGQVNRMHFMIDEFVGPRNSLLYSSVCNSVCANASCTVNINSITTTSVNSVQLLNSLILSGPNVTYTFSGTTCSSFYNTFNWSVIDLSNNTVVQTGTGSTFPTTFTATGNYRIILTSSIASSTPVCSQSASLNIQVLPPASCPNNLDMSLGWNASNWERIEYEGGWSHTTNNSATFTHPTTTLTIHPGADLNGTTFSDPFSFTTSIATDPNFGTLGLPFAGATVMRVGRVITTTTSLPAGDASYVTYTFSPTNQNAKIRVYYLGLKEHDVVSPNVYPFQFASNSGAKSGFGFVCNYNFSSAATPTTAITRGLTHTGFSTYGCFNANDMVTDAINTPTTALMTIGTSTFDAMGAWQYMDLDFSEFVCASPTISITFFARSDEANTPGILHSYAYFAAQCLPSIEPHIDINLVNKDIACMADVGQSCFKQTLPPPNPYTYFQNGWNNAYTGFLDVKVDESNDGITYTPTAIPTNFQYNPTINQFEPYLNLCKTPDTNPYKFFKITYKTLCQTTTQTLSIFQGFVHTINDCAPNPMSGGHFTATPITSGTITYNPDQYQQICSSATLSLGRPCWLAPADPDPDYQWEVNYGSWTAVPGGTMATLSLTNNPVYWPCVQYRRQAKYYDPYCNNSIWIASDLFSVTNFNYNSFTYVVSGPDVCGNSLTTFSINNFYEATDFLCDRELAAQTATTPVTNSVTFSFFSSSTCAPGTSLTANTGPSVFTYTYLNNTLNYTNTVNQSFTFNNINTYTANGTAYALVTVTRFGCTSTFTINIPIKIKPSAIAGTITPQANLCTNATYSINGNNTNPTGYYWEYSYSPTFVPTLTLTGATSYSLPVTVGTFTGYPVYIRRVANGTVDCPDPAYSNTITINNTATSVSITPSSSVICSGTTVTLTASGAATYTWNNGVTTTTINPYVVSPTVTTAYTVTGTSAGGCTNTAVITITVSPTPTLTGVASATICQGGNITYTAGGASSYTWTSASLSSTLNPITLSPTVTTVYTLTGQNSFGCIGTFTFVITVSPLPTLSITPSASVICANGTATLTASGATSYTWTYGATTSTVNPLVVTPSVTTTYTLTGQNAGGCSATATILINVSPTPTIAISPSSSTICAGTSETLTASGAGSYTWTAPPSTTSTTNPYIVTPSVTTVYTVSGTTGSGCPGTQTVMITVNPTPTLTGAISGTSVCNGGCVTATLSGAIAYTWTAASFTSYANPVTLCPTVTTTYTVTGVNAFGCVTTKTRTIVVLPVPTITVTPSSSTICAGSSETLIASGASSYTWTSPTSSTTTNPYIVTPTVTTTYTVSGISQDKGCIGTQTVMVTVLPTPTAAITGNTIICSGDCNTFTASGGVTYNWSTGATSSVACLPSGVQSVTVTAANGCTVVQTVTVTTGTVPTIGATAVLYTICAGSSTTLNATGGTSYTWTAPPSFSSTSNPVIVSPTVTTVYTVAATKGSGPCLGYATVTIVVLPAPSVTVSGLPIICTGCATLTALGGGTYSWSTGATTSTVCISLPGIQTVTVTGVNGCKTVTSVAVSTGTIPSVSISASSSSICPGTSATLTAFGASSYGWTGPSYSFFGNPAIVSPTVTTTYTVSGTNGKGCAGTQTVTVIVAPAPTVAITGATSGCAQFNNTLTASGGGTYLWNTGATTNTLAVSGTTTTVFTCTVTGANGCKTVKNVTITVNPANVISVSGNTLICSGQTATLTASGAVTYSWSTGSTASSITTTAAGVYTVTGTIGHGCISTKTIAVSVIPSPTANITGTFSVCHNTVILTATGGGTYLWNTSATTNTIAVSVAGVYAVTVTAANGCTAVKQVTVTTPFNCLESRFASTGGENTGDPQLPYIYPNPTTQSFNIGNASGVAMVELFDYTGKLLKQITRKENNTFTDIDIKQYVQGAYFVRLINADKTFSLYKLIKD